MNNEKIIIDIISSSRSLSQKGDVSKALAEQGFFENNEIPKGLSQRDKQLSGGNPIDILKEFEEGNFKTSNESVINQILNHNLLNKYKNIIIELESTDKFNYLGEGQHGIALVNNNLVYKLTDSEHEKKIVKLLKDKNLKAFTKILKTIEYDNILVYIRPFYSEIDDSLASKIYEELSDIDDFFKEKNMEVRKSNTNLTENFNDNFLDFLNNLKKDLKEIGNPKIDFEGMSINTYKDEKNYILVDF
jgi:hypothetical protein